MTHLQRGDLKPIIWNDAEERAAAVSECFMTDLKYDDVQIFKDLPKEKVLEKLNELEQIAGDFSVSQKNKRNWLGISVFTFGYFVSFWKSPGGKELR